MSLVIKSITAASVATPPAGKVSVFFNSATERLSIKDEGAVVTDIAPDETPAADVLVTTLASAAGVLTIDWSLGTMFRYTMTENITSVLFTNLPAANRGEGIGLLVTQHASAPKTMPATAWPSTMRWFGAPYTVSSTAGAQDEVALSVYSSGGYVQGKYAKASLPATLTCTMTGGAFDVSVFDPSPYEDLVGPPVTVTNGVGPYTYLWTAHETFEPFDAPPEITLTNDTASEAVFDSSVDALSFILRVTVTDIDGRTGTAERTVTIANGV